MPVLIESACDRVPMNRRLGNLDKRPSVVALGRMFRWNNPSLDQGGNAVVNVVCMNLAGHDFFSNLMSTRCDMFMNDSYEPRISSSCE